MPTRSDPTLCSSSRASLRSTTKTSATASETSRSLAKSRASGPDSTPWKTPRQAPAGVNSYTRGPSDNLVRQQTGPLSLQKLGARRSPPNKPSIDRFDSPGLSTSKKHPSIPADPETSHPASRPDPEKKSQNARQLWIKGYRTLKYMNVLQYVARNNFLEHQEDKAFLSTHKPDSQHAAQPSIIIDEKDGINVIDKNEFSALEFSINKTAGKPAHRLTRMNSFIKSGDKRVSNRKIAVQEKSVLDVEVRENKNLNTTYIRENKMVGPKGTPKDLGFTVSGKRTKINQYVLVTMIGKGGWGKVFLGIDVNTKQKFVRARSPGAEGH